MPTPAQKTDSIVRISTDVYTGCKHCKETINGIKRFDEAVNHYIKAHGYRLLRIGQETSHDDQGKIWHSPVAALGK